MSSKIVISTVTIIIISDTTIQNNTNNKITNDITSISWCENNNNLDCLIVRNNDTIVHTNPMIDNKIICLHNFFNRCVNTINANVTSHNTTNAFIYIIISTTNDGSINSAIHSNDKRLIYNMRIQDKIDRIFDNNMILIYNIFNQRIDVNTSIADISRDDTNNTDAVNPNT